jgi:hypothetical protein
MSSFILLILRDVGFPENAEPRLLMVTNPIRSTIAVTTAFVSAGDFDADTALLQIGVLFPKQLHFSTLQLSIL